MAGNRSNTFGPSAWLDVRAVRAGFDHVVVGAGSGGAVAAARLSEDPALHVLLIEAGADHSSADTPDPVASPNFFGALAVPGRLWPGVTAVRGDGLEAAPYARGRGCGGSSAVNALMAIRGVPADYDAWETDHGCTGWGWATMSQRFLQIEDDLDHGGDGIHGQGGPIPLARHHPGHAPLDDAVRTAAVDLGYPVADDYHAPGAVGLSRIALTLRDGRRVSTNDAYLEPARGRPNLTVRGDTLVDRVDLDGRRCTGVVTSDGERIGAGAVTVSAGAIHTPAILLRSGIGPDTGLPVGENLLEHQSFAGFEMRLAADACMSPPRRPVCGSVIRYTSGLGGSGAADMQIVWFNALGDSPDELRCGRMFGAAMQVFSRGSLRLRSPDPTDDPVVELRLLSDPRDRERVRDCVRRVAALVTHPAVAAVTESVTAGTDPVSSLDSDEAIDAWLAANVNDYVHAAGTCRMGAAGDPRAVVDPSGRVHGYEGLRVCDASVMADIPRANTHLTTVALAEEICARTRREDHVRR